MVEKTANTKRVEVLKASAEKTSLNYKDNLAKVTALYKAELTKTVKTHILLRDMADDIQVSYVIHTNISLSSTNKFIEKLISFYYVHSGLI